MNLIRVGTSRCDVPARKAGGIAAPLNAARTAQRAVPTKFRGSMSDIFHLGVSAPSACNFAWIFASPGLNRNAAR